MANSYRNRCLTSLIGEMQIKTTRYHLTHVRMVIIKFRLKLKKVGKTTKPFRHDLIQLPNDYIREGNGNPLKYCCLENPMDGGAW